MSKIAALLVATFVVGGPVVACAADPKVIDIRAYLFMERSGKLSGNIIGSGKALYNTMIGEGDAGGPANQVLVDVVFAGDDAHPGKNTVTITRRGRGGKPIVQKKVFDSFFFGPEGISHGAILVEDAVCGTLKIEAEAGKSRKSAEVAFTCGE